LGSGQQPVLLEQTRRAPQPSPNRARTPGELFNLELKLQADVALIGFPNVGKSTLIARVSAARPKIADYPFTHAVPNLGVVRVGERSGRPSDATEFVMADFRTDRRRGEGADSGTTSCVTVERARVLCVAARPLRSSRRWRPRNNSTSCCASCDYQADLLERPNG